MKRYLLHFIALMVIALPSLAKNLTETGSYQVRLANPANNLNCRTGPGLNFPIRVKLEHGDEFQVLHVTAHRKPWFYTNLRCFVRAHSQFLQAQNNPSSTKTEDPTIIR